MSIKLDNVVLAAERNNEAEKWFRRKPYSKEEIR